MVPIITSFPLVPLWHLLVIHITTVSKYLLDFGTVFIHVIQNDDGEWIEDEDQVVTLKANFIISAFGSGLSDENG